MERRKNLQKIFENITPNVYFQPPPTLKLKYPCIKYKRSNLKTNYANNVPYVTKDRYMVTVIDSNPDSEIPRKVRLLPSASFDRTYQADQMNHDVYEIYY